jgi:hypothetical protein
MLRVTSWLLALAGACAASSAAGCGSRPIPTKGTVTLDGRPLADASVIFLSQEPGGQDATGYTDADGVFQLTTFRRNDGAMPGLYKITVRYSKPADVPPNKSAADAQKAIGESQKAAVVIPDIYSRPDMTILKHKIPDDGEVKLELRSTKT